MNNYERGTVWDSKRFGERVQIAIQFISDNDNKVLILYYAVSVFMSQRDQDQLKVNSLVYKHGKTLYVQYDNKLRQFWIS